MTEKSETKKVRAGPGRLSAEAMEALPDRLLDAAFELFSEQGFADTSMQQIAAKAGASTKTLYSRYGSKIEMLQAVIGRMIIQTLQAQGQALGDPREAEPRAFLTAFFNRVVGRLCGEAAGLNRLALREGHRIENFADFAAGAVSRPASFLAVCLEIWRDMGLLPWLKEPLPTAVLAVSMATDPLRIRMALGANPTLVEMEKHVAFAVDHFLKGCGYNADLAKA